ncbi:ATPase with role in protein import into the ER [Cadophora gregata]|uniref:ATPase with role in protein import into the ER n=1 Tax=Cadophora gregata TaxID=51156 RepID=UPI0026DB7A4D|nr:ATPase with role in protein import into the ER [Cadophora gregata]KAK0124618.1 ATPase with role in protein import into the ER [Cadophora gregata]KAK0129525.1 ATPase with role in protein import into the ER, variant 2 [Cadophora gregata f. sp. sojae]
MRSLTTKQTLTFSTVLCIALLLPTFDYSIFRLSPLDYTQPVDTGPVVGIDLGLKYSRVGIVQNDTFEMIADEKGRSLVPSVVAYTEDGKSLVGFEVQEKSLSNPKNTIYDIRHLIGGNFSDPAVQSRIAALHYEVVQRGYSNGSLDIKAQTANGDQFFSPEDITAMILSRLKTMAETYLDTTVTSAVVAVPSYFTDTQRTATREAAKIAGLDIFSMIDEPIAAAFGHRLDLWDGLCDEPDFYESKICNVVVYDIQETEWDLTLLEIDRGVFELKTTVHNDQGRGLLGYLPTMIQSPLKFLGIDSSAPLISSTEGFLKALQLRKQDIHSILVTGDPKLISEAQRVLEGYFTNVEAITNPDFSNDEAVVRGVALRGAAFRLSQEEWDGCSMTIDVLHLSMGIEASNGTFHTIIRNGTAIPNRKSTIVTTTFDNQEKVVVNVWEGQRLISNKNRLLGTLELTGISPRPKGLPRIEVSLEVDANRILRATARDLQSDNENWAEFIVKARKSNYTEEILRSLLNEAGKFREEDELWAEKLSRIDSDKSEDGRENSVILVV